MSLGDARASQDPITAARGSASDLVTVLYLGGLGRSGSTLLDRMLGQLPGFVSVGELIYLWLFGLGQNRLCGCGRPFRECPFWRAVGDEAFGGWDRVDVAAVTALTQSLGRPRRFSLLFGPRPSRRFRSRLVRYQQILARLYAGIAEVSGARVIIDSSNLPPYAYVLRGTPGVDLRFVHLVRDSRGVAYSWTKKVARPDVTADTVYMKRYHPARTGTRWITHNLMMDRLGRAGVPGVRVRYESLVRAPRREMERILAITGEKVRQEDLGFIEPGRVHLQVNHTVHGNPMRMHVGELSLRVDDEWRSSLGAGSRGIVTALTWPLLRRYGYVLDGGRAEEGLER